MVMGQYDGLHELPNGPLYGGFYCSIMGPPRRQPQPFVDLDVVDLNVNDRLFSL